MPVATQFLDGLREREIVADRGFDDFHQFRERKFKWNRRKLRVFLLRNRIRRRHRAARNGDARPSAQRGIVAKLGDVGISRALDVREPVARFGMDVDFVKRMTFDLLRINPQHKMTVGGLRVQLQLLRLRQIPVRVKPVRVARGEKKFFRAIGFRQFGFSRRKRLRGRRRAERVFLARSADGHRRGRIAFEQNGRGFDFLFAGVSAADEGFGGDFGFRLGGFCALRLQNAFCGVCDAFEKCFFYAWRF